MIGMLWGIVTRLATGQTKGPDIPEEVRAEIRALGPSWQRSAYVHPLDKVEYAGYVRVDPYSSSRHENERHPREERHPPLTGDNKGAAFTDHHPPFGRGWLDTDP